MTIKTYAFKTSPYPVIVNINNCCSWEQQHLMGELIRSTFGRLLLYPGELVADIDGNTYLPSPAQLKYRIIVRSRRGNDDGDDYDDGGNGRLGLGGRAGAGGSGHEAEGGGDSLLTDPEVSGGRGGSSLEDPLRPLDKNSVNPFLSELVYLSSSRPQIPASSGTPCDTSGEVNETRCLRCMQNDRKQAEFIAYTRGHLW